MIDGNEILDRIREALAAASDAIRRLDHTQVSRTFKTPNDPVTEADLEADRILERMLVRPGEGWLSEEREDDDDRRLSCRRVWIVDPIDGTREFLRGVPEWAISVGLAEDGEAVAGGICNPASGETIVGALGVGVFLGVREVRVTSCSRLDGASVLASRSETRRGDWERFAHAAFAVRPVGSVAYKLGLVAAGRADATWTCVPKHEWDVCGGVALVRAGGGVATGLGGEPLRFNRPEPRIPGLIASAPGISDAIVRLLRSTDAG